MLVAARQRTTANPIDTLTVVRRQGIIICPLFLVDTRPAMRSFTDLYSPSRLVVLLFQTIGVENARLTEKHIRQTPELFCNFSIVTDAALEPHQDSIES
jgi:hypothetical protein